PVVLGQRWLHLVAPASQLGGVEGNALDGAAGLVAALVVRIVIAPAVAADQPNTLADKGVDNLVARAEENFETLGRRRRSDVADHVGQVGQAVLVRVGDALGPHQRVVRQPDYAAGQARRPAHQ